MQTLWIICDVSGSMVESGKRLIARGLAREVEQYCRLGHTGKALIRLVAWGNDANDVEWNPNDELPALLFDCKGSSNADTLTTLLGHPDGKALIITDGYWSNKSKDAIKQWKEQLPEDTLRIIKVGADSNPRLKGADVFTAEEFFPTMDAWLEGGE